ncbi:GNAT family N-acetyltransferase [uncultured Alsobacter sp.]|uniref:GNAT family N-acetyltransferase n=1 Tax=uncultured Alsobacter sp. TaxID=1748258 RepID=UPI0025FAC4DD|nr:GNAT family N-acetyltransferase [uncultured Alsobacter sp.]
MGALTPPQMSRPEPLSEHHRLEAFDSGEGSLNRWLLQRARANQTTGASRTYVVCLETKVVGYYALATGGIDLVSAPSRLRRNMPDPIPAVVLARLAVDQDQQGRGLGKALVQDAMSRILQASQDIGIALVLVHALDDRAKAFYRGLGFRESPLDPLVLMIGLKDVRAARLIGAAD